MTRFEEEGRLATGLLRGDVAGHTDHANFLSLTKTCPTWGQRPTPEAFRREAVSRTIERVYPSGLCREISGSGPGFDDDMHVE